LRHLLRFQNILTVLAVLSLSANSFSATTKKELHIDFPDNSSVAPQNEVAPKIEELGFITDSEIDKLSENFKEEAKRRPSSGTLVGTEDMLSKDFVVFRDKLIKCRSGLDFYELIKSYDEKYEQIPATANDLKFVVAKLATWLPLRGIVWRMTPLVHKIVVTQQAMLATLRNMAEQMEINFPDSHVEAQMLFLTMPAPDLIGKEFKYESNVMAFLSHDVYQSLKKSVQRLEKIQMNNIQANGQKTPVVFDARLRFGTESFNSNYDAFERFKIVGEAERFATLARINRRMYGIASVVGYNWNGHLALKREIGKMYGLAAIESALFDMLPGDATPYVKGATREARTRTVMKYKNLYTLNSNGKPWMAMAYYHLRRSSIYLQKAWTYIKNEDMNSVMQLDPEIFMARKEQVEAGIENMKKLTEATGSANGQVRLRGALSGDEVLVDLKGFYMNPPQDLKKLLPTSFAHNEDLNDLKKMPLYKTMTEAKSGSDLMKVNMNGQDITFRNYLFGRATGWNVSKDAFGTLFPGSKKSSDIATAMRVLNETRGARLVTNGLTIFVR